MYKKRILVFTGLIFIRLCVINGQNLKIDSLKLLVEMTKSDTNKINLFNEIADKFVQLGDSEKSFVYLSKSSSLARKINYTRGIASAYRIKASLYYNLALYAKTIEYASLSLGISKQFGHELEESKSLVYLCGAYYELGNYNMATRFAIEGLMLNKRINSQSGLAASYNMIAIINQAQGNFTKSLYYYKMTLNLTNKSLSVDDRSAILSNLGTLYISQKNYDSAMFYFHQAEKLNLDANTKKNLSLIYLNMGECYYIQNKNKEALYYFNSGLRHEMISPNAKIKAGLYLNVGSVYLKESKLALAEKALLMALKLSEEISSKENIVGCDEKLAEVCSRKGNYKQSLYYYKKYMILNNELFSEVQLKEINKSIANYEVELKEKEIQILVSEKKQKEAEEIVASSKRNSVYFMIAIGLIVLLFFAYYLDAINKKNRNKRFTYLLLQSQEDERKRIAKELHDGIGHTLLAIKNQTGNTLVDATINELRTISRNLHPIQLEKLGLKVAIESILRETSENYKIFFSSDIDDLDVRISPKIQIHVYRIIQECISNIIKHSDASAARVIIKKTGSILNMTIFDNGKGFDVSANNNGKSLGLSSIEERVGLIGGKLYIYSKAGETKIEIEIKNV